MKHQITVSALPGESSVLKRVAFAMFMESYFEIDVVLGSLAKRFPLTDRNSSVAVGLAEEKQATLVCTPHIPINHKRPGYRLLYERLDCP
jgi:hypothetical protein